MKMPDQAILVTGAAGFIGFHVTQRLLQSGHRVVGIDNLNGYYDPRLKAARLDILRNDPRFQFEKLDVADRVAMPALFAQYRFPVVIHLAAQAGVRYSLQDPHAYVDANLVGFTNVLEGCRHNGCRHLLFASSSSVYGATAELPKQEDMSALPVSPYAVAKLACEGYCRSFGEVYGLETVALRYFNVFGPRQDPRSQYAAVVPNFITALLTSQRPTIFGDGEQSRDFTYVENVIEANLLAMAADVAPGGVYNVACGEAVTLNQLVAELRELIDSDIEPVYAAPRAGDVRHSLADLTRSRRDLDYEPSVSLREGLRRSIEHLRDRLRSGELTPAP